MLHRFFAIMLIANFVVHGVGVVRRVQAARLKTMLFGPVTMLPRPKDFRIAWACGDGSSWAANKPQVRPLDLLGKIRLRRRSRRFAASSDSPACCSGSRVFFARYLPGWMFNVATIVHGYEALLAIGFIFTIHFFNAHLRLEKFPVDDVMFTGQLAGRGIQARARSGVRAAGGERRAGEAARADAAAMVSPGRRRRRHLSPWPSARTIVVLIILAGLKLIWRCDGTNNNLNIATHAAQATATDANLRHQAAHRAASSASA